MIRVAPLMAFNGDDVFGRRIVFNCVHVIVIILVEARMPSDAHKPCDVEHFFRYDARAWYFAGSSVRGCLSA